MHIGNYKLRHLFHQAGDDFQWRFVKNKANLRDLIAATGLVILLKLDSNRRFSARVNFKFKDDPEILYYIKLCASFQIH